MTIVNLGAPQPPEGITMPAGTGLSNITSNAMKYGSMGAQTGNPWAAAGGAAFGIAKGILDTNKEKKKFLLKDYLAQRTYGSQVEQTNVDGAAQANASAAGTGYFSNMYSQKNGGTVKFGDGGKSEDPISFSGAFANARRAGLKTFTYKSKTYTTELASEAGTKKDKVSTHDKGSVKLPISKVQEQTKKEVPKKTDSSFLDKLTESNKIDFRDIGPKIKEMQASKDRDKKASNSKINYTPKKDTNYSIQESTRLSSNKVVLSPSDIASIKNVNAIRPVVDYKKAGLPNNTKAFMESIKTSPKENFAVVDKGVDSIYYFNPSKQLIDREPVITGQDQGIPMGLSMGEFMKKYKTNDHDAYFEYLKKTNQRITPSEILQINGLRENVATNPDKKGRIFNSIFRPEREELIKNNRLRDYGSQQKLFTFMDSNGVGQSTAIHGTDNPAREKAFKENTNKKLSNGCINCTDDSRVFDILTKGSKVAVVGDDTAFEDVDLNKDYKYSVHNSKVDKFKKYVFDELTKRKVGPDTINNSLLSFITTLAEKESKMGDSKLGKVESMLPYSVAKSQGMFEINPDTFKEYLPSDYSGSTEDQIMAAYNFYTSNYDSASRLAKKTNKSVEEHLYNAYNSSHLDNQDKEVNQRSKKFKALYQRNVMQPEDDTNTRKNTPVLLAEKGKLKNGGALLPCSSCGGKMKKGGEFMQNETLPMNVIDLVFKLSIDVSKLKDKSKKKVEEPEEAREGAKIEVPKEEVKATKFKVRYFDGGDLRLPFEEYYKTIPENKRDTISYNLRRAYDLAPKEQLDAFAKDPDAHLFSVYEDKKTGIYEFMKSKNHPTLQKELDWYNSDEKEAVEFKAGYDLDKSSEYYKYVPKKKPETAKFRDGGQMNVIPGGVLHAHKNNIGDKGIPVVMKGEGGELKKIAEIEKEEIIFTLGVTEFLELYAEKLDSGEITEDELIEVGKRIKEEITKNTVDKSKKLMPDGEDKIQD